METPDNILIRAAKIWKELTEYNYVLTYGYKGKLETITIIFSTGDFPHLAGFQYKEYTDEKHMWAALSRKFSGVAITCAGGDA